MKLIINADDFGLTLNVSRGIIDGIKTGVITDTSAIVCACDFIESAKLALSNNIKEMGVHCLLTMGKPILDKKEVSSLIDSQGKFYTKDEFLKLDINYEEVKKELDAQIQTLLATGLKLNHIDSHHGIMNKSKEMAKIFIELAQKYNVPLRNESVRLKDYGNLKDFKNADVLATEDLYFNRGIPYHTIETVIDYLDSAKDKFTYVEIGSHPGISDDKLRQISVLNDDRDKELDVFISNELKEYINQNSIELISYSNLGKD